MPAEAVLEQPWASTSSQYVEPGWRVWRYGRWHTIRRRQLSPDRAWIFWETDGQVGTRGDGTPSYRTFHVAHGMLVAAEALP